MSTSRIRVSFLSLHLGTVQPFLRMTSPRRQGSTIIGGQKQNYEQA
jgi:hypothetical protein